MKCLRIVVIRERNRLEGCPVPGLTLPKVLMAAVLNNGVNNTAWTGAASNSPAVAAPVGARGLEPQSRN